MTIQEALTEVNAERRAAQAAWIDAVLAPLCTPESTATYNIFCDARRRYDLAAVRYLTLTDRYYSPDTDFAYPSRAELETAARARGVELPTM